MMRAKILAKLCQVCGELSAFFSSRKIWSLTKIMLRHLWFRFFFPPITIRIYFSVVKVSWEWIWGRWM